MGAISVLGFIVWAQNFVKGLQYGHILGIKPHSMLETSKTLNREQLHTSSELPKQCLKWNNQQETFKCDPSAKLTRAPAPQSKPLRKAEYNLWCHTHTNLLVQYSKGSSETLCGATFYNSLQRYSTKTIKARMDKASFMDWLVGFVEGDGCFSSEPSRCALIIQLGEKEICCKIKQHLGGSRTNPKPKVWRLVISGKQQVYAIMNHFNGNIILQKRKIQFEQWVNHWHTLHPEESFKVQLRPNDKKPSFDDAWFSGFIDAEGCFYVKIEKNNAYNTGYRLRLRFILDQKNAMEFWPHVKNLRKSGNVYERKHSGTHRFETYSLKSVPLLCYYLQKFPRKTRKRRSFSAWKKCFDLIEKKQHLCVHGLNQIRKYKNKIAKKDSSAERRSIDYNEVE